MPNFTGPLAAVQQANYLKGKTLDSSTGEETGGALPWDQQVAIYTQNGGQGGSQGLMQDMNKQGAQYGMSAQDFGATMEQVLPNLYKFIQNNPNSTWARQFADNESPISLASPEMQLLDQTAANYADRTGVTAGSADDLNMKNEVLGDWAQHGLNQPASNSVMSQLGMPGAIALAAITGGSGILDGLGGLAAGADVPYDVGMNLVNNPELFGSGALGGTGAGGAVADASWGVNPQTTLPDAPYDAGENLVNNPDVFNPTGPSLPNLPPTPPTNNSNTQPPAPVETGSPTMNPGQTAPGGSTAATSAAQQSALARIANGTGTLSDYLSVAGTAGSTLLGVLGSDAQRSASNSVADKYLALGQPYRDQLSASYQPGFTMANDPGYTNAMDSSMSAYLRQASTGGNPFSNPGVSADALKYVDSNVALPQLNTYRSQLGTFGQLGLNTAGTNSTNAAAATGGAANAVGFGLNNLTNPNQSSFSDLMKQYGSLFGQPSLNTGKALA